MALGRQRLSQRRNAVQPEVWLDRAEFQDLIRPQVAQTVEPLRGVGVDIGWEDLGPALPQPAADRAHPSNIDTAYAAIRADTPAPTTVAASGHNVPELTQIDVPDLSSVTTIPLNLHVADVPQRPARSPGFKRFAAAGVLALIGGASVSLMAHGGTLPPSAANPAPAGPAVASPVTDPASSPGDSPQSEDPTDAAHMAPAAAPNKPADGPVLPEVTSQRAAHNNTHSDNRTTTRSKSPTSPMTSSPSPRTVDIPTEAYAWWAQSAPLRGNDPHGARLHPQSPSRP